MPVSFQCPSCQATYSVSDPLVGRRLRCPSCDTLNEVIPDLTTPVTPDLPEMPDCAESPPVRPPRFRMDGLEDPAEDAVELDAVDIVAHEDTTPAIAAVPPNPPFPRPPKTEEEEPDEAPPPRSRLADTEMDMTPMVDVTFQLLIFFMITAAFALQKAKEIPKPEQQDPSTNVVQAVSEESSELVVVRIDEFDTFTVIDSNQDEDEAASIQDLYIKLRRAKSTESGGKTPTKMRVESHPDSTYERIIAALDAGHESGFAEIQLARSAEEAE